MSTGSKLKDSEIVRDVVDIIQLLDGQGKELSKQKSEIPIPFMFLDGSSGMGKTQMAFTLMSREDLRVHYLVCCDLDLRGQPIYRRYDNLSSQFLQCIRSDCDNSDFSSRYYRNFESEACGFIVSLITQKPVFKPMTVAKGTEMINSYLENSGQNAKPTVMFLDEFPHLNSANLKMLRWMRNLCRILHLVTICSSTSSSAANLIRASSSSRDTHIPKDWCYVLPRFPKVLDASKGDFSEFENYLFNNSRPLFSTIFEEKFLEEPTLDISQVLGSVGVQIHDLKKKFGDDFAHGQICLLLAMFHMVSKTDEKESAGVFSNSHFANLVEDKPFVLQIKSNSTYKRGSKQNWIPCLSFPHPKEDILLFLCLIGNKGYYPICKPNSSFDRIPFLTSLKEIKSAGLLESRAKRMQFENPDVRFSSGLEWEASSTAIVSLCSHYDGLNGIEFGKFISHVLYELECLDSSSTILQCRNESYNVFSSIMIPFLSVPSVPWPEELLEFNSKYNFRNLRRSLNKDRVDFMTDSFYSLNGKELILSGECKDWNSGIERSDLEDILVRIPQNSVIHLVFLKQMKKEYYGSKSRGKTFKSFVKGKSHLKNKLILRFDHESKDLVPIPGIPMDKSQSFDGLVLFITIDPV